MLHKRVAVREGRRMSALAAAYSSAIKYAMMGVEEEAFAAHFPDTNPDLLEILWQGYRQVRSGPFAMQKLGLSTDLAPQQGMHNSSHRLCMARVYT